MSDYVEAYIITLERQRNDLQAAMKSIAEECHRWQASEFSLRVCEIAEAALDALSPLACEAPGVDAGRLSPDAENKNTASEATVSAPENREHPSMTPPQEQADI